MAFKFKWGGFDQAFVDRAKNEMTQALNRGENKPSVIAGPLTVVDISMGTMVRGTLRTLAWLTSVQPPELEIMEINELSEERFGGIFRFRYRGDAFVEIETTVQVNTVHFGSTKSAEDTIVAASAPLVVPMTLKISSLQLNGIVALVVSRTRGVTITFKNDPFEAVQVNSTFDESPSIRRFLQLEIENQLRGMFIDDIPKMVHRLSIKQQEPAHPPSAASAPSTAPGSENGVPSGTDKNERRRRARQNSVSVPQASGHHRRASVSTQTGDRHMRFVGDDSLGATPPTSPSKKGGRTPARGLSSRLAVMSLDHRTLKINESPKDVYVVHRTAPTGAPLAAAAASAGRYSRSSMSISLPASPMPSRPGSPLWRRRTQEEDWEEAQLPPPELVALQPRPMVERAEAQLQRAKSFQQLKRADDAAASTHHLVLHEGGVVRVQDTGAQTSGDL